MTSLKPKALTQEIISVLGPWGHTEPKEVLCMGHLPPFSSPPDPRTWPHDPHHL